MIGSIIGAYFGVLLFLIITNVVLFGFDGILYDHNRHNESRGTVRIGVKWLFWRSKKDDSKEIFKIVFIHEMVSLILFLLATIMFILSLILQNEIIILICLAPAFIYICYIVVLSNYRVKKIKNN